MEEQAHYYSKQAGLIAMANRFKEMGMWEVVEKEVQIKQKIRISAIPNLDFSLNQVTGIGRGCAG
jgi:hypothetical protein